MADFRTVGKHLSNWGRWGTRDCLGTLNFINPGCLAAAASLIVKGSIFDLSIPIGANGVQMGMAGRINPVHHMSVLLTDPSIEANGLNFSDDWITMPLQSATQWDGLGHIGYDGQLFNGHGYHTVNCTHGSLELKIEQVLAKGIAGRGVLLDIAALRGVESLRAGEIILPAELEAAEKRQKVRVRSGDILLIRTGWIRQFTVRGSAQSYWQGAPGIDLHCAEWLHSREVAAIASDNWGVEVVPPGPGPMSMPVHGVLIRDMGMTLGEIFDLESLAEDCARDGRYEFFFSAPPLKVLNAVGSPVTPLAFK